VSQAPTNGGDGRASGRLAGLTDRDADWAGLEVVVAGIGLSGFAAADALLERRARVLVVDGRDGAREQQRAQILRVLGARVDLGVQPEPAALQGSQLVVTSPGWRPDQPLLGAAATAGVPVWGEVELAWRMRARVGAAPWLTVTGTNGKTTTVQMLESILRAAGRRAVAAGNVGLPLLEAVLHPDPYDVLAVELSSFQLHWSHSISAQASACLNVAPDHVDWHGSLEAYARDKGRVYERTELACVYNVADPETERLVRDADVVEGCRAIGFTLGTPAVGMVGVVDDVLCDRAFIEERRTSAAELATLEDLVRAGDPPGGPAAHTVANALAAAALARAHGVPARAVRDGLRAFAPGAHRIVRVADVDGVGYVDDSKATNPHAAAASLAAFGSVVWVAGGLLKGASVEDLVRSHAGRLRGVVLLGQDRAVIADALSRHAPDVPVVDVASTDTDLMDRVVEAAAGLARPGDVVLLAPAAASMDQFRDYAARGDAFADAVRRLAGGRG
jgi:UDP-N-acetylmuramoylalanine--D-glutamate ligase